MRNLLALVGLVVVGFAGIGWYCGWYKLSVGRAQDGNLQIETEVETKKVVQDSSTFMKKVGHIAEQQLDKKDQPSTTPGGTPGPVTTPNTGTGKDGVSGGWLITPNKITISPTGNQ